MLRTPKIRSFFAARHIKPDKSIIKKPSEPLRAQFPKAQGTGFTKLACSSSGACALLKAAQGKAIE